MAPTKSKFNPHARTTVRDFDIAQTKEQIGRMNMLAISGGRSMALQTGILMAAGQGYYVAVMLTDSDTYSVYRLYKRSGQYTIMGETHGVYFDEVGEVAYRAGMYNHSWGGHQR
jgi:predicted glutamine amidotransferase